MRILKPAEYKQRMVASFEARAVDYDNRSAVHPPLATRLVQFAELQPGEAVLDVATGTGHVALLAAKAVGKTGRVLGIDISQAMLDKAVAKPTPEGARRIEWLCVDAETAELPANSFDAVLCCSAMPFMQHIPAAVARFASWCKPGGRLVFNTALDHPMEIAQRVLHRLLAAQLPGAVARTAPVDPHLSSTAALQQLMQDCGMQNVQVVPDPETYEVPSQGAVAYAERMWAQCINTPWAPLTDIVPHEQLERVRDPFVRQLAELVQPHERGGGAGGMVLPYTMVLVSGSKSSGGVQH